MMARRPLCAGRGPRTRIAPERQQHQRAGAVRDVVKSRQHRPEQRARQFPVLPIRRARLQDFKGRRRHDGAEHHHSAEPHDEREDRRVPEREHPVIIVGGFADAARAVKLNSRCSTRQGADRAPLRPIPQ